MERETPDAILMVADTLTLLNRQRVYDFARQHRIAAIYEFDALVRDGGLMSYGLIELKSSNVRRPSSTAFSRGTSLLICLLSYQPGSSSRSISRPQKQWV